MNRSFLIIATTLLAVPLLGVAVGYLVLAHLLIPTLGLGDVERIVRLGEHLDQRRVDTHYLVFLGNSITMEGIDTTIVMEAMDSTVKLDQEPAHTIENLALSGCGVNEQRVLLPKLLRLHPNVVVLPFGPASLEILDDLPLDKAYAYAMSQFPQAWPESYTLNAFPGLRPVAFDALLSSSFEQTLHFRTAPLNWFNGTLRLQMRSDLRGDATADWLRPYHMLGTVPESTLNWHLESLREKLTARRLEDKRKAIPNIRDLVTTVSNAGAVPALVVLPIHPRLHDDAAPLLPPLRELLAELAKQNHGIIMDASDLLTEKQFADAIHPNAEGREAYSRFVGSSLAHLNSSLTLP